MSNYNKSLKSLMIEVLAEEVVIIKNKLDKISMETGLYGKDIILIDSIPDHSYILSTINNIHSIAESFNILYDVAKKSDELYTMQTNISNPDIGHVSDLNLLLNSNTYIDLDECFEFYNLTGSFNNNQVLIPFAEIVANTQKRADLIFYSDNPTKDFNNDVSGNMLNELVPICRIIKKLGISELVYEWALMIYDFTNSGRSGYTLKDNIIQKVK